MRIQSQNKPDLGEKHLTGNSCGSSSHVVFGCAKLEGESSSTSWNRVSTAPMPAISTMTDWALLWDFFHLGDHGKEQIRSIVSGTQARKGATRRERETRNQKEIGTGIGWELGNAVISEIQIPDTRYQIVPTYLGYLP